MRLSVFPIAVALTVLAVGAHAQQAKPGAKAPQSAFNVALSVKGPQAIATLSVTATSADIRDLLRDMAKKADATVYFSPSVTGTFSGNFDAMDPDAAISTVVTTVGCKVMRINLPKDVPVLTETAAGKVYDGMLALPPAALARDARSKRSMTVSESTAAAVPDGPVIYYVQGKLTPDQEQAGAEKRDAAKAAIAKSPQTAIQNAVNAFQAMTPQDRMNAMRDVQRQLIQNMSPQDRQAMFGGRGGGRGGRGNRGGG